MTLLHSVLGLLMERSQTLIPLIAVGFFIGEFLAKYFGIDGAAALIGRASERFIEKLNKVERGIATRLYRGMIALLIVLTPAVLVAMLATKVPAIANLIMLALFGRAFHTWRVFLRWRKARANALALELPEIDFLFKDAHAVLRYSILASAEAFTVGVVGTAFWFLIGGLPFAVAYLVIAEVARLQSMPVFGWASNGLFRLLHFLPHLLALLFLTLGAIFVPRAKPLAVAKAKRFHGFISYLLDISLGGKLPGRDLAWEGTGTPKLLPEHLARWQLVRLVATLFLLFALAAPTIAKILKLL